MVTEFKFICWFRGLAPDYGVHSDYFSIFVNKQTMTAKVIRDHRPMYSSISLRTSYRLGFRWIGI